MTELIGREKWEKNDPIVQHILQMRQQDYIGKLEKIQSDIRNALPYAVQKVINGNVLNNDNNGNMIELVNGSNRYGVLIDRTNWAGYTITNIDQITSSNISYNFALTSNMVNNITLYSPTNMTITPLLIHGNSRFIANTNHFIFVKNDATKSEYNEQEQRDAINNIKSLINDFMRTSTIYMKISSDLVNMLNGLKNKTQIENILEQIYPNNYFMNIRYIPSNNVQNVRYSFRQFGGIITIDYALTFDNFMVKSNILLDILWMLHLNTTSQSKPKLKYIILPSGNVDIYDEDKNKVTSYVDTNVTAENFISCNRNTNCSALLKLGMGNLTDINPRVDLFANMDYKSKLANAYMILRHLKWPLNNKKTAVLTNEEITDEMLEPEKPLRKSLSQILETGTRNVIRNRESYADAIITSIKLINDNFEITKLKPVQSFNKEKKKSDKNKISRLSEEDINILQGKAITSGFKMFGGGNVPLHFHMGGGANATASLNNKLNLLIRELNARGKQLHENTRFAFVKKLKEIKALEEDIDRFIEKFTNYNKLNPDDGKLLITDQDMENLNSSVKNLSRKIITLNNGFAKIIVTEKTTPPKSNEFTF